MIVLGRESQSNTACSRDLPLLFRSVSSGYLDLFFGVVVSEETSEFKGPESCRVGEWRVDSSERRTWRYPVAMQSCATIMSTAERTRFL